MVWVDVFLILKITDCISHRVFIGHPLELHFLEEVYHEAPWASE